MASRIFAQPSVQRRAVTKEMKEAGWTQNFSSTTTVETIQNVLNSCAEQRPFRRLFTPDAGPALLHFEELHLRNIRHRQMTLLEASRDPGGISESELHKALHEYREAVENFKFMSSTCQSSISEFSNQRGLGTYLKDLGIFIFNAGQQEREVRLQRTREYVSIAQYAVGQFAFATMGGLMLIVPLIIMVYVPGRTASVVTTCISVFLFATQLAVWSTMARILQAPATQSGKFEAKDIIGATAAYAAVLVVFVGTSISPH